MNEIEVRKLMIELETSMRRLGAEKTFGDPTLIKLVREINQRVEFLERTDGCPACEGKGREEHDCNCPHCYTEWIECEKCGGTGRIEKNI